MKLTCPACQTVLNSAQDLPSGKRIKCSACATIFTVGESAAAAKTAPSMRPARRANDVEADDEFEHRPVRRRSQAPVPKRPTNLPIVLTLCAVGAVIFIGIVAAGVVGAIWYFGRDKTKDFNEANNPRPVIVQNDGPGRGLGGGIRENLQTGPKVGEAAPEIDAEDIEGTRFKLGDYRGKVVLLDFWGNW